MTKEIPNFSNYNISDNGIVTSKRVYADTHVRKQQMNNCGYCMVSLIDDKGKKHLKSVHRLVAEAFIPNPDNKPQVNHINGNKCDNSVSNLEWCTAAENTQHAYANGLISIIEGEDHHSAKLTKQQAIDLINCMLKGEDNETIANKFNLHSRYVSLIRGKKRWKSLWDSHFSESSAPISKKLSQRDLDAENLIKDVLLTSLSNADIGRKYSIDPSTISKIRTGKRIPDRYKLFYDKYTKSPTTIEHQETELVE